MILNLSAKPLALLLTVSIASTKGSNLRQRQTSTSINPFLDDEPLQYTPDKSDWSTFYSKAVDNNAGNTDHSPDGIGWIPLENWNAWDGTPIDPTEYTRQELAGKICRGGTVLGIRDVFYDTNPFSDVANPTKAEVDSWHAIAVNHVRALVGYTDDEYIIRPDRCLHLRALWSDERYRTRKWDTEKYPGSCLGSTNPHCGASFIPDVDDQQEYLPSDGSIASCGSRAGSEGLFSAAKSNVPWSMKWARPFCQTLAAEGFWGGHTGPWFHRPEFGWGWWDGNPEDVNSNAGLRTKWSGSSATVKYVNPDITNGRFKVLVEGVNPDPRFEAKVCKELKWFTGEDFPNATACYDRMMDDDTCGKKFMTYNSGGCACYPTDMEICEIDQQAGRLTWDFEPIQSSFDGLLIDTTKSLTGNQLPYNGRRCPNILWKTKAGDAAHCLQIIMLGEVGEDVNLSDCGRNFITYNTANGGCACYPETQTTCTRQESIGESGRTTYELEVDPTWTPPSDPSTGPTTAPTNSPGTPGPTSAPTSSPTTPAPTSSPTSSPITPEPTIAPTNSPVTPEPTSKSSSEPSHSPRITPSPSDVPSMVPSLASSSEPSHSPSNSDSNDDVICIENNKSKFFSRTSKGGDDVKLTCKQLRQKDDVKIAKICSRTKTATDGTKPAKDVCVMTCKTCKCGEIDNQKFFVSDTKSKSCITLKNKFRTNPTQAQKWCDKDEELFDDKPVAKDVCRTTCGTCPASE